MKRIKIFIFLFPSMAFSQGIWYPKQNVPAAGREGSSGFSIGQKGYMGTGLNNGFYYDFWEWDQVTNSWSQKASLPAVGRAEGIGFSIGAKGYLGMGWNIDGSGSTDTMYNDLYEWDQDSNTWIMKSPFPGSYGRAGVSVIAIGTKAYIGLGADTVTKYNDWWEWDQGSDTWTQKANFPGGIRWHACHFTLNGKGYIGTGADNMVVKNDFWEYDPVNDLWTKKADFPGVSRWQAAGFALCNYGYVGIGSPNAYLTNTLNDFYRWNPVSDSWSQVASLPDSTRREAAYFTIGNAGYLACGGGDAVFPITMFGDLWEYIPESAGIPDFTTSLSAICAGQCYSFSDVTTNNPVEWQWNFPGSDSISSSLQNPSNICYPVAGTYPVTLTVTTSGSCGASMTITKSVMVDSLPVAAVTGSNEVCSTGTALLTASGGTSYIWNTGSVTSQILVNPVASSVYSVTVSNACGSDTAFHPVAVHNINVTLTGSASCGNCTGTANAYASGGTPPYTYQWSNGETSASVTGLCPGSYTLTVSDYLSLDSIIIWNDNFSSGGSGWTLNSSGPGTNGSLPNQWIINGQSGCPCGSGDYLHITCNTGSFNCFGINPDCGYTDGPQLFYDNRTDRLAISQDISTIGSANLTLRFNWISNGEPGNDYCKVRISNDGGITWTEFPTEYSGQTNCQQETISIPAAFENIPDFRIGFRWVNDADGNYNDPPFGVDDIELIAYPSMDGICYTTQSLTITVTVPLTVSEDSIMNNTVFITVSGGTPPYTYLWSNGETVEDAMVGPGAYIITVTDSIGCTSVLSGTTGTGEYNTDIGFSVHPNPSDGTFIIVISDPPWPEYEIVIRNVIGQVLVNDNINSSGKFVGNYFLQPNDHGIIFISVYTPSDIYSAKILMRY